MAVSKPHKFTAEEQEAAALAKALAHSVRVVIIKLLAARQACVCGELVLELPLSQSTVSQHLKELKAAGLVQGDVDGPRVCYCLAPAGWARARQLLGALPQDSAPPPRSLPPPAPTNDSPISWRNRAVLHRADTPGSAGSGTCRAPDHCHCDFPAR